MVEIRVRRVTIDDKLCAECLLSRAQFADGAKIVPLPLILAIPAIAMRVGGVKAQVRPMSTDLVVEHTICRVS
ncbi:hypothetical protein D3C86_2203090 [compost metagenome]